MGQKSKTIEVLKFTPKILISVKIENFGQKSTILTRERLLQDCYIFRFVCDFLKIFEQIRPKTLLGPQKYFR